MALDFATVTITGTWQQSKTNTGFSPTIQGPDAISQSTALTVGASNANSLYAATGTLAAAATLTIDLQSFTDQLGQAITMTRAYSIIVKTTGAALKVEPGASNGLVWFFAGTTPSITIPADGAMGFVQPTAATVDATHKTIKLTNVGAVSLTYNISIIGGP